MLRPRGQRCAPLLLLATTQQSAARRRAAARLQRNHFRLTRVLSADFLL